ncbi:hypothetical protein ACFLXP_01490 [Chloroflexota bacterium]
MGYFTILAAIPGFFLSSLILMLLWGVIAPNFGGGKNRLPHVYTDYYYFVADNSAPGGSDRAQGPELTLFHSWN